MECTETERLTNREFYDHFNRKTVALRIPLSGGIELTHRCNLRCVHCYLGKKRTQNADRRKEMGTDKICSVIDEVSEAGCLNLLITGGEPLMRADFPHIYRHAKKRGLLVTVFTNGTLLTDTIVSLFEDLPPKVVEISLYGATAITYEKVTGIKGSYAHCMNGITKLREKKVRLNIKTILMTLNSHEFFGIQNLAERFRAKFRLDAAISPCMDGDRNPLSFRVNPEDAVDMEFSIADRYQRLVDYRNRVEGYGQPDKLYTCGAGSTNFHIDPYGTLQPCLMTKDIAYDLTEGGFIDGWHGIISSITQKKAGEIARCNTCEKRYMCDFCPAFFAWEKGSEQIISEYICSMGNERFKKMNEINQKDTEDAG